MITYFWNSIQYYVFVKTWRAYKLGWTYATRQAARVNFEFTSSCAGPPPTQLFPSDKRSRGYLRLCCLNTLEVRKIEQNWCSKWCSRHWHFYVGKGNPQNQLCCSWMRCWTRVGDIATMRNIRSILRSPCWHFRTCRYSNSGDRYIVTSKCSNQTFARCL